MVTIPVELSRGNVFDRTGEEPTTGCAGDCDGDGDGAVRINELVRAVNIASLPTDTIRHFLLLYLSGVWHHRET